MAGQYPREVKVAFDDLLPKLDDQLAMSQLAEIVSNDQTAMARQGDVIWLPVPQIATSSTGSDATLSFKEANELVVPTVIDQQEHVALIMTDREMRDSLRKKSFGDAAIQKLASVINVRCLRTVSDQATVFIKRTGAAAGFDDAAAVSTKLDQLGVNPNERIQVLSPGAYRGYASDLQKASRSFGDEISNKALRKSFVGEISGLEHIKLDYALRQTGNTEATATATTLASGANVYVPVPTSTGSGGQVGNVDNRYQTMTFATARPALGDHFTIANVFEVHPITKEVLPDLKTFKVIEVLSSTTCKVSPPMISAQNGEQAALQYKNCNVSSASATAAVVILNSVTGFINPGFVKGALRLLPGRLENETGSGARVMYGETKQGIQLRLMDFTDINTGKTKMRWDVFFGVNLPAPDQAWNVMFSQT
jgi:hypothetical protein